MSSRSHSLWYLGSQSRIGKKDFNVRLFCCGTALFVIKVYSFQLVREEEGFGVFCPMHSCHVLFSFVSRLSSALLFLCQEPLRRQFGMDFVQRHLED